METVILRFPHISQHIFKRLDIKSLTKCRIIARIWNEFICSEKNFWIEIILHLTYAKEVWRKILKKSDLDNLSKFAKAICKHYKYSPKAIRKRMTPLHFAAQIGEIQIVKNSYIEKEIEKNPKDLEDWTPLHLAAQNGHLSVCQMIIDSVEVNFFDRIPQSISSNILYQTQEIVLDKPVPAEPGGQGGAACPSNNCPCSQLSKKKEF